MISLVTRRFRRAFALPFLVCVSFLLAPSGLEAQTTTPATQSILPGPKPPDASLEWKQLVGIYRLTDAKEPVVVLERNLHLFLLRSPDNQEEFDEKNGILWLDGGDGRKYGHDVWRDDDGLLHFSYLNFVYSREDAGSDPTRFYHVSPAQPISVLREKALKLVPPVEAGPFRKPDLVELASLDPRIHLDIRYASGNNFLSTPVYTEARAFMQRPAAEALLRALRKLQPLGYGLLIHDAYRPWYVTKIFWDATPPEGKIFVANPQEGSRTIVAVPWT
jgi:hypothetical protein